MGNTPTRPSTEQVAEGLWERVARFVGAHPKTSIFIALAALLVALVLPHVL